QRLLDRPRLTGTGRVPRECSSGRRIGVAVRLLALPAEVRRQSIRRRAGVSPARSASGRLPRLPGEAFQRPKHSPFVAFGRKENAGRGIESPLALRTLVMLGGDWRTGALDRVTSLGSVADV